MKKFLTVLFAMLISASAFAQSGYHPGQKVADFTLKSSNGQDVALSSFNNAKTVVVVFFNNSCPYAKLYENRLINLNNSYNDKGVRFIFVNPTAGSPDGGESIADMAKKVTEGRYNFPYLADEGQKVSQVFGATKTPEVFVIQNSGNAFVLKYRGAIDDNPQAEKLVKEPYLKNAIEAVLINGNMPSSDKRATGCLIRKY